METQRTAPIDEQPVAQIIISNKLDKSRLSPFEQQPTSLDAIIVKDKPAVGKKLKLSSNSLFIQPSSSVDAQNIVTSAPKVNKLNLSRFSLFEKPKQNVEQENKVASSIVDTNIDEMPLIRLDQLVVEVTDHHENTVSTCETKNKSPIPSQNADDPSVPLFEQQPMQPSSTAAAAVNASAPILNKLNSSPLSGPKVVSRRYYDYNHLNHRRYKTKKEKKQEKKLMAAMDAFIVSTADDGTLPAQHGDLDHLDELPAYGERNSASVETFANCVSGSRPLALEDEQPINNPPTIESDNADLELFNQESDASSVSPLLTIEDDQPTNNPPTDVVESDDAGVELDNQESDASSVSPFLAIEDDQPTNNPPTDVESDDAGVELDNQESDASSVSPFLAIEDDQPTKNPPTDVVESDDAGVELVNQESIDEWENVAIFPCKLEIVQLQFKNLQRPVLNIIGVKVVRGIVRIGTPLCVLKDDFVRIIGKVTEIQHDKIQIAYAIKNMKVAIKIDCASSSQFKLYDQLVSIITRESIDACKDHFRDDLDRDCWKLMRELKAVFNIRDPAPAGTTAVVK